MNTLPIVRRELVVLSRRRWFYWLRSGVGFAMALASCIVFIATWNSATPQNLGAPLFYTVTVMTCLFSVLAGPVLLADCIAEEKTAGTLGLLFLTDTRSIDIVGGKFLALAMPAIHCLLAAIPIMGVAFFLGGVTAGEFVRTTAALVNLLFFSLAATILCSAIAPTGRHAFGFALVVVLACCGGLPALLLVWPDSSFVNNWLTHVLAGPMLAFWNARDAAFYSKSAPAFTSALVWSHVLGWAFLAAAASTLPFCWRERTDKFVGKAKTTFEPRRNAAPSRQQIPDPLTWVARHRLGGTVDAWLLAAATMLAMVVLSYAMQSGSVPGMMVALVAYAMHGVFKVWVAWVSSRAFSVERESGALELLFVTPLGENAIWKAWLTGLRQRFLIPALALVAFDVVFAWRHATAGSDGDLGIYLLTVLAVPLFLMDCYTLTWVGLWSGLAARNQTRACIRTLIGTLIIPGAFFFNAALSIAMTTGFKGNDFAGLVCVWFIVSFLINVVFGTHAMIRLSHDCRETAVIRRA